MIVAVTPDALVITPFFPFNLMFIPEIYGLEARIEVAKIRRAAEESHFGLNVCVTYDAEKSLRLRLRNPTAFIDALNSVRLDRKRRGRSNIGYELQAGKIAS